MEHTEETWELGWGVGLTGGSCPSGDCFAGGKEWPYTIVRQGENTIAVVPAQDENRQPGKRGIPEEGSDKTIAQLIVAAPDLLEACQTLVKGITGILYTGSLDIGNDKARAVIDHADRLSRAAIAKAKP